MKQYNYNQINEHIQWLIKMMDIEYPNNYQLVINNIGAQIRNTQSALIFIRNDGTIGMNSSPDKNML